VVPLYEYQCGRCGRFEVIRKFSDAALTVCPTCGQEVQKLLSAPAIQFKGTGWYITDYARKSSGGDAGKDGGSKSSPSTKEAGGAKDGGGGGKAGESSSTPAAPASTPSGTGTAKGGSNS
jgi:putative FmdB family regulatory protein